MSQLLPPFPNLEHLKGQAKDVLRVVRRRKSEWKLADAQHAVARGYGFSSWPQLKTHVDSVRRQSAAAPVARACQAADDGPHARNAHPIVGTWALNASRSTYRASQLPHDGVLLEFGITGNTISMTQVVVDPSGRDVAVKLAIPADGHRQPVRFGNGLVLEARWADSGILEAIVKNGEQIISHGTYMVSRAGKIEQAAGGVLFLDEVGEMSPAVQAKFLRVLQEREFQRLGGSKTLKADARVIAATNRDPKIAMERGQFREDLYYRLSVFEIALPPLRERREDILLLVDSFLGDLAKSVGRPAAGLSEDAKDRLLGYAWPGNVRELRNAIERAVILCEGGLISSEHLPIAVGQARSAPTSAVVPAAAPAPAGNGGEHAGASLPGGGLKLDDLERDLLHKAMAKAQNNKSQAAKLLGVPRGQFYSLLKRHGMTDAKR